MIFCCLKFKRIAKTVSYLLQSPPAPVSHSDFSIRKPVP